MLGQAELQNAEPKAATLLSQMKVRQQMLQAQLAQAAGGTVSELNQDITHMLQMSAASGASAAQRTSLLADIVAMHRAEQQAPAAAGLSKPAQAVLTEHGSGSQYAQTPAAAAALAATDAQSELAFSRMHKAINNPEAMTTVSALVQAAKAVSQSRKAAAEQAHGVAASGMEAGASNSPAAVNKSLNKVKQQENTSPVQLRLEQGAALAACLAGDNGAAAGPAGTSINCQLVETPAPANKVVYTGKTAARLQNALLQQLKLQLELAQAHKEAGCQNEAHPAACSPVHAALAPANSTPADQKSKPGPAEKQVGAASPGAARQANQKQQRAQQKAA
jgi:flagellar hook-length control protein FliK